MLKIITIVGARPQFIKAAVLSNIISNDDQVSEIIIHTGQHYDESMSKVFFESLNIGTPKYFLGFSNLSHGEMTGRMIIEIERILILEKPDLVLVYGDTNSTLAGALAAAKIHVPICHVEAGLRSRNRRMPEEVNRVLTDHLSDLLFTPSREGVNNLNKEGIFDNIYDVGDIMLDACNYYRNRSSKIYGEYILCTIHRQENTDNRDILRFYVEELNKLSVEYKIIIPLHPRTRNKLSEFSIPISDNIEVIEPIDYLAMINLINNSLMVITDSGGLQKEAFYMGKQCITLRNETEWGELVNLNVNYLFKTGDSESLLARVDQRKNYPVESSKNIYGDGNTGKLILKKIKELFLKK